MKYSMNEGSIELPDNWHDRSVHVLLPAVPEVLGSSLVITRDDLPYGSEFIDYIEVQKNKFKNELPDLDIKKDEEREVDGRVAHLLEFSWKNDGVLMHQLAVIALNDRQIITFTYTSPKTFPKDIRSAVGNAMLKFKFTEASKASESSAS